MKRQNAKQIVAYVLSAALIWVNMAALAQAEEFVPAYQSEQDPEFAEQLKAEEERYVYKFEVNENDEEITDYTLGWILFPLALPALIYMNFVGWWE